MINHALALLLDISAQQHSYISRLFSPENLPNIVLICVGIGGIWVAVRTLNHMRESMEQQLRAYVVTELGSIANIAEPLDPPSGLKDTEAKKVFPWGPVAYVQIKNTGQTPAFKVVHWAHICFREFPLEYDLPPRLDKGPQSFSTIGPGIMNTKTLSFGPELTKEQVAQLRNATGAIYVYGEITYECAFRKHHCTKYRLFHNQNTGPIGVTTELTFAAAGNEAD